MSYVPELIFDDLEAAEAASKVCCLYFDRSIVSLPALTLPLLRPQGGALVPDPMGMIEIERFRDRAKAATAEGRLAFAGIEPQTAQIFAQRVDATIKEFDDHMPTMLASGGISPDTEMAAHAEYLWKARFTPLYVLATLVRGVLTTNDETVIGVLARTIELSYERRGLKAMAPVDSRARRDVLAHASLNMQLPNVADLQFEQVLELRRRQADGILRFRSEMARLVTLAPTELKLDEWVKFVRATMENHIEPAIADLRRQHRELRSTSALSFVGGLNDKLSMATATATALGFSIGGPLAGAAIGGLGVTAAAVHGYLAHQAEERQLLAGSPFSLFLEVPRNK